MSERPILFTAPMVRALLREAAEPGTGKTQTRRILKPQPMGEVRRLASTGRLPPRFGVPGVSQGPIKLPYEGGDRCYVRETWRPIPDALSECAGPEDLRFAADVDEAEYAINDWTPSIHMPRWASRLTLLVTAVRVERLQAITEADAIAEGIAFPVGDNPRSAFVELWGHLNGPHSWARNPWVAVISFTVRAGNIDRLKPPRLRTTSAPPEVMTGGASHA